MATSADYPPYEFIDSSSGSGEVKGFDVDVAQYIAKKLGYELQINNMDFNRLIPALQAKRVDLVMAGLVPTEERKKHVGFTQLYYEPRNTILTKKGSSLTVPELLSGKTIGAQMGSTQEQRAQEIQGTTIKLFDRIGEMIQKLEAGQIEAAIVEETVSKHYTASNVGLQAHVIPNIPGKTGAAIAFPQGSLLLQRFDAVISEIKSNGTIEELAFKWFGDRLAPTDR